MEGQAIGGFSGVVIPVGDLPNGEGYWSAFLA